MGAAPAAAQSIVWSLPDEDTAWIRYEGTYKDKQAHPESSEGDLELEWRRELTIKSLGKETADWKGKPTPCRWLEIKAVTGKESEQGIQPGPVGTRIYKVLVPEKRVFGRLTDSENVPVIFLDVIKGYRKVGDREPAPIQQKVLAVSPMLALVEYYPNLKAEARQPEELQVPLGAVSALKYAGSLIMETDTARTSQEGTLWVTKDAPFGLAKFQVKVVLLEKEPSAPKEDFKQTSEIIVEMSAVAKGNDARSDLPDLK